MKRIALALFALLVATSRLASAQQPHPPHHYFQLGSFALEQGGTLPGAQVLYVTHGTLNADRSNAILIPSWYGGNHHGYDFLIGTDRAIDPDDWFVIVTEMFASGGSTSPSNMVPPRTHETFPAVTIRDNVEATRRLVTEAFGITHLRAIIGFSMGAEQAFQWAVSHPDFMDLIVPIAGTAKTYPHGIVRLESALTLITQDPEILAGRDTLSTAGTRAWSLHWSAWTRSTEWWKRELFRSDATPTVEAVLARQRGAGAHLAMARHRRHAGLRRGRRAGARVDPGARALHARCHRHVLPHHRRRVRAFVPPKRRLRAHPVGVGPHGRGWIRPGRPGIPQRSDRSRAPSLTESPTHGGSR